MLDLFKASLRKALEESSANEADDRVRRFVLVAGEVSGDKLGAALIRGLSQLSQCAFRGIGGPEMQAEGLYSLAPMERLVSWVSLRCSVAS